MALLFSSGQFTLLGQATLAPRYRRSTTLLVYDGPWFSVPCC